MCVCVCVCVARECAREGETVSAIPGGVAAAVGWEGVFCDDLRLPLTAVCVCVCACVCVCVCVLRQEPL